MLLNFRTVLRERWTNARKAATILAWSRRRNHLAAEVRAQRAIREELGIEHLEAVQLGGVTQWILSRGQNRNAPLLLFLQGGIDCPAFINVPLVGIKAGLEQHFVVVYWDRRGVGKSRRGVNPQSVTLAQTVDDVIELSRVLLARHGRERLFLVGHSWGSAMAMLAAARRPDLYYALTASGQVIQPYRDRSINYRFALEKAQAENHRQALAELEGIGLPPYTYAQHLIHLRWTAWSRGFGYALGKGKSVVEQSRSPWLRWRDWAERLPHLAHPVPEYSTRDVFNLCIEPEWAMRAIGDEFYALNLIEQVKRVEVPVYFCQGRHEFITPPEILEDYFERLQAPAGKQIFWFDVDAHAVYIKDPERFGQIMAQVLAEHRCDPEEATRKGREVEE